MAMSTTPQPPMPLPQYIMVISFSWVPALPPAGRGLVVAASFGCASAFTVPPQYWGGVWAESPPTGPKASTPRGILGGV